MRPVSLAAALASAWLAAQSGPLARFEYFKIQMGTRVRIVLYAEDEARARAAAARAFERVDALERVMTDYDPESELMRLASEARTGPRPVSPDLFDVLERAERYARISHGAFDPTVGPLVALWRGARRTRALPTPDAVARAHALVGYRKLRLDRRARSVSLRRPGMTLDLGGIGKGYAADGALSVLRGLGIERALVAAGGDLALGLPPPSERGWRVAVADPGLGPARAPRDLVLSACGVSTSGDTEQFVEIAGRRYSHIIDPRSGAPIERSAGVTVVAPDDTEADALATACAVLSPAQAVALADSRPGVAAFLVVRAAAGGFETHVSRRMRSILADSAR
jgi:thiamine biosynthesis lipoprotein